MTVATLIAILLEVIRSLTVLRFAAASIPSRAAPTCSSFSCLHPRKQCAGISGRIFIDTSQTIMGVEVSRNDARYIAAGQPVEITFKFEPGIILTGKVETVFQAISTGQTQVSGTAAAPTAIEVAPFVARMKLDGEDLAKRLPAGSTGTAAIFTEGVKPTHITRRFLLRQQLPGIAPKPRHAHCPPATESLANDPAAKVSCGTSSLHLVSGLNSRVTTNTTAAPVVAISIGTDMACSLSLAPLPASLACGAGARPDHPISGNIS
jgi:hypothetical protein